MFILRRPSLRTLIPLHRSTRASHSRPGLQLSVPSHEILDGTPHYDVEITEENVDDMAKVLIKHFKSSWDVRNLQRTDFKGGLSNKVIGYLPVAKKRYGKFEKIKPSDMILIRLYGEKTDMVKDHAREVRNIDELSKNNIISPLYFTFSNGYCSEYIEGNVLTPADFRNTDILRLTANCMAELHTIELSEDYLEYYKMESTLFNNIGYYLEAIPPFYKNMELQKRFESSIDSVEKIRDEIATMIETVSSKFDDMTVSYCHNDFHPINLIFNERIGTMHVIDHERGSPNFSAYDIGNYFNEFAGIHDMNYSLYPTKETQFWWLRLYLRKVNELNGSKSVVTNADIFELHNQVQVMSMVSHLFWITWALFRAGYPVSDFDYMGYGIVRLNEYYKRKREVKRIGII